MKKLNKKLAIALACAMISGSVPVEAQAISDIKGHWAETTISEMKEQGFISGYADGSFQPDKAMTRAEFVAALNKILGLHGEANLSFSDVKSSDWFAKELAIALKHGYIKGYADGTFRPNMPVSRLEAAVLIARANKLTEKVEASDSELQELADGTSVPDWAKTELAAIVKSGIMKGNLEKVFQGEANITRAEAVVSFGRAKKVKETLDISGNTAEKKEVKQETQKEAKKTEKKAVEKKSEPLPKPAPPAPAPKVSQPSVPSQPSLPNTPNVPEPPKDNQPSVPEAPEKPEVGKPIEPNPQVPPVKEEKEPEKPSKEGQTDTEKPDNQQPPIEKPKESTPDTPKKKQPNRPKNEKTPELQPEGNEISRVVKDLKSGGNPNVNIYIKDGEERAIIWTKGIMAPTMHEEGNEYFKKSTYLSHIDYKMDFAEGQGWYDVNKTSSANQFLCAAAVSANMLHWWMEQNEEYIGRFIEQNEKNGKIGAIAFNDIREFTDSFRTQDDSQIFNMWTEYFGATNGVWADTVTDLFINGYKPKENGGTNETGYDDVRDNRGGFFHSVFADNFLTRREGRKRYDDLSNGVKDWLKKGSALGISYSTAGSYNGHIYTVWGAEYDTEGKLKALYISDSDDYDERNLGMKRLNVVDYGSRVRLTSSTAPNAGPMVEDLYSLSLGTEYWEAYFQSHSDTDEKSDE